MDKTVQSHRDLKVWQKAMDLAAEIYRRAVRFPLSETYRLVPDFPCRSLRSCEHRGRPCPRHTEGLANFVAIAKGSLMDAETFLMLAVRLEYLTENEASAAMGLITENSKMLKALRSRLVTGQRELAAEDGTEVVVVPCNLSPVTCSLPL
jgi:four helix bundle protein